jgi:hypothetical protein
LTLPQARPIVYKQEERYEKTDVEKGRSKSEIKPAWETRLVDVLG